MNLPKLVMFDLDNTLAESKSDLTDDMAALVKRLLERTDVAVISGGGLPQFLKQVVGRLPHDADLKRLYLLPTSGAALYEYDDGGWDKVYEERIPESDAQKIEAALEEGTKASGVLDWSDETWGPRIEYRGSQVSLSVLGQQAPVAEKKAWDPDKSKRLKMVEEIQPLLPQGYQAAMGGSTTIDVTKNGIDKAYGVCKLCERLHIKEPEALYVGDQLVKDGNDEAVFKTNAKTKDVLNPKQTALFIQDLIAAQ